jgi:hypothetical protein
MKKPFKIGVIALLACAGLVLIASEPIEDVGWVVRMLWKSLAGFGCWGVCALLYKLWVRYER